MSVKLESLQQGVDVIWWVELKEDGTHLVELTDYNPGDEEFPLTDEEAWEEVQRQRSCLEEWLESNPAPSEFRFVEGRFDRFAEEFSGYGNPWNEAHDGPLVEDCYDEEVHHYLTW